VITGSIKTHDEPVKYKKTTPHWVSEWDQYDLDRHSYHVEPINWKVLDDALFTTINRGTLKGLIHGARVRRSGLYSTKGLGTITHIHRTHTLAYNYSKKTLEPFKVTWDNIPGTTVGGTFDYSPEGIETVEENKHLPILLVQTKDNNNENHLHLCESN